MNDSYQVSPRVTRMTLWPTEVMAFEFSDDEFHSRLKKMLVDIIPSLGLDVQDPQQEIRIRNLFEIQNHDILVLKERFLTAAKCYLGEQAKPWVRGFSIDGRAVIIRDRDFLQTHNETRESDLAMAYFLTGDAKDKPISFPGNPRFVLEDPSRSLNDLRLPWEMPHCLHLAPRPGLLVVFPAHIPHHQQPYRGPNFHIQIVGNIKIHFTEEYFQFQR